MSEDRHSFGEQATSAAIKRLRSAAGEKNTPVAVWRSDLRLVIEELDRRAIDGGEGA